MIYAITDIDRHPLLAQIADRIDRLLYRPEIPRSILRYRKRTRIGLRLRIRLQYKKQDRRCYEMSHTDKNTKPAPMDRPLS